MDDKSERQDTLSRTLTSRHLYCIAIGGTIGTGLFVGSGQALATGGPCGTLVAFVLVGILVYAVMISLGEMAAYIPVPGSFCQYAARFVDPSLGFAMGWIYWFSWAITWALELTTAGIIIQYWNSSLNIGIFIAIFWVVFTAVNFLPVKIFGEIELVFSAAKVVTLIGFIVFSVCINAGSGTQGYLGFTYWHDPGPFVEYIVEGATGKFVGVWAVMITASFSYQGAELVGVGAGETRDPAKNVPEAIRWTFWGLVTLFVSTIFFIGINVPSNNDSLLSGSSDASASPLVVTAQLAGVPVLPDILNAVLLSAVLSAANSNVYSGSRVLVALADEGAVPRIMAKTNRHGIPYYAVAFTSAFGLLAFMNLSQQGSVIFDWLMSITATAGLITWACINICHLCFMSALKAQGIQRSSLPYVAPLQPYLAWFGVFFNILILITNGFTVFMEEWATGDFFAAYISIFLFAVMLIGHKLIFKTKPLKSSEVDLVRGRVD